MKFASFMSTMKYATTGVVVIALGALAGWYLYLRQQGISITEIATGRGFSEVVPSFNGPGGSTYQNIIAETVGRVAGFITGSDVRPPTGKLWHVDMTPVAGMGFVLTTGSSTLSYAQQATGHIFNADLTTHATERRTHTLVPKTYRALFSLDGSFVMQSIDDEGVVRTIAGTPAASSSADTSTTTPKLGMDMPRNLRSVSFDTVQRTLYWLTSDPKGGLLGASVPWGSATGTRLFSTTIGSWHLFAVPPGRLYATIAPEDGVPGYAYEITKKGTWVPIVRNVPGLSFLPSEDPGTYLYSSADGTGIALYLRSGTSSTPALLPMSTIADKCAWTPGTSRIAYCAVPETAPTGPFIGPWYRGLMHTVDSWWEIDATLGTAREIYSLMDANDAAIDVYEPVVDPTGNYIAFLDAKDQSLWLLRVH